jgi:hypothetical protein
MIEYGFVSDHGQCRAPSSPRTDHATCVSQLFPKASEARHPRYGHAAALCTLQAAPCRLPKDDPARLYFGSRHDDRKADLTPAGVRYTDYCGLGHIWKIVKEVLDFRRVHVLSSRDEHVFQTINNENVAVGIANRDISRTEPSIPNCFLRGFGPIPITWRHDRSRNLKLTSP